MKWPWITRAKHDKALQEAWDAAKYAEGQMMAERYETKKYRELLPCVHIDMSNQDKDLRYAVQVKFCPMKIVGQPPLARFKILEYVMHLINWQLEVVSEGNTPHDEHPSWPAIRATIEGESP